MLREALENRREIHLRHSRGAKHRVLRRAQQVGEDHARPRHPRGQRLLHGRCGEPRLRHGIGTLAIVPAAGLTHAASGIAEALLAGIPMLVITGGIRTDLDKRYQLHEIDQHAFMKPLTKASFRILRHEDVVPTIFEAYRIATSGEPGPVFVELPVNLQLSRRRWANCPLTCRRRRRPCRRRGDIARAADLLLAAKRPGLFVGWGAVDAAAATERRSPNSCRRRSPPRCRASRCSRRTHPLHAGFSFGRAAAPAGAQCLRRLRLPARRRHALRRDRHRQLRRHGAGEPDAHRHQPAGVQQELPGESGARRRRRRPCCRTDF